jgi:hypothetical protein
MAGYEEYGEEDGFGDGPEEDYLDGLSDADLYCEEDGEESRGTGSEDEFCYAEEEDACAAEVYRLLRGAESKAARVRRFLRFLAAGHWTAAYGVHSVMATLSADVVVPPAETGVAYYIWDRYVEAHGDLSSVDMLQFGKMALMVWIVGEECARAAKAATAEAARNEDLRLKRALKKKEKRRKQKERLRAAASASSNAGASPLAAGPAGGGGTDGGGGDGGAQATTLAVLGMNSDMPLCGSLGTTVVATGIHIQNPTPSLVELIPGAVHVAGHASSDGPEVPVPAPSSPVDLLTETKVLPGAHADATPTPGGEPLTA